MKLERKLETCRLEVEDSIGLITSTRPEVLNTMNLQWVREMRELVEEVDTREDIRVYIVTGGPRPDGRPCFSAGGDLKYMQETIQKERKVPLYYHLEINELFNYIEDLFKPSIAAIDGVCTAGGIELAEACDLRIAADTAQISDFHLRNLGSGIGGAGASNRLIRMVGLAKAKEIILTGKVLDGKEAERIGFVNHCVPSAKLMEAAMDMARKIADMFPLGVKSTLAHMDYAYNMDFYQGLRFGDYVNYALGARGKAHEEARRAFVEKQPPPWQLKR